MARGHPWLGVALLVAGCSGDWTMTTSLDPTYYTVGPPPELRTGRIVRSEPVRIAPEVRAGPAIGAVVGAVLGPVGSLVGSGLGHLVERWVPDGEGVEYLVQTEGGRLVTLVQDLDGAERPLAPGAPVLVELGPLASRVVALPGTAPGPAPDRAAGVRP